MISVHLIQINRIEYSQFFIFARRESADRGFLRKMGSDMNFDLALVLKLSPPLTLLQFFNFVTFLFHVFQSHIIHLFLLITSFNILICLGGTSFLTRTEVVVTSHCFEHCFTVITININIKTVNFLLFSRCEKALNFTYWSLFLVERHDHILKVESSSMSSLEFLHISVKLPSRVQSCWHILTH